jgi:hypothetical protein
MDGRIVVRRVACAAFLISALFADPASAQRIAGQVILEGWGEPLPGAMVLLIDPRFAPVDSVRSGDDGAYAIAPPGPGSYFLQARHGQAFGPLAGPLELSEDGTVDDLVLEFPSPLFRQALDCFEYDITEGTGVLAGVVYDPNTDIPLPGARITLEWDAEGIRRSRDLFASDAGRFVACAVPAEVPITARVYSLGAVSIAHANIRVGETALARHDLTMDLRRASATLRIVSDAAHERADGLSDLTGSLVDASTGQPIQGARVQLSGRAMAMVTGQDGRFRATNVEAGSYTIEVEHLGYGQRTEAIDVPGASAISLELRLAAQTIELGEITVRARRETLAGRMAGAAPMRTLAGERIEQIQRRGALLYEALYEIPGLRLNYARAGGEGHLLVCAEIARGRTTITQNGCNMVEVFLDGVAVPYDVAQELLSQGLQDYERIELLRPLEAMRWGFRANEAGALFLWTQRGRAQSELDRQ